MTGAGVPDGRVGPAEPPAPRSDQSAAPGHPRAAPAALLGVVAGLLGIGTATLLAALLPTLLATGTDPAPVTAVANAVIDRTPGWLKDLAIASFGTADKLALLVGLVLVITVVCALIGVLAGRRPTLALVAFALLTLLGMAAVLSRPNAAAADAVPTALGGLAGLWYLARGVRPRPSPAPAAVNPTRRLVLGALVGGSAAYLGIRLGGDVAQATASRAAAAGPLQVTPLPDASAADLKIPGLTPFIVPNEKFYRIDTAFVVPKVNADTWRLRVTGLVEREIELDWATLRDKHLHEALVTLTCVSNEVGGNLVGNATWTGWPVRELLAMAGPKPDADMVLQTSADGWTCGTPLAALTDDRNALLAIRMNGQPLPFEHGFPVRVVVPGLYGYVSACKWVTELKVTRFAADEGYWTPRGWSVLGPIKTASRIDVPQPFTNVPAGRVAVAGVAWAQHRGIAKVEVQVDDGPWTPARLAADASIDAWRQWVLEWDAPRGSHTIRVRATDRTGQVQTPVAAPPAPNGASGWHTISVRVD